MRPFPRLCAKRPMPDNNPALRATIARQVAGVFGFQFTSTFEIGGRNVQHGACLSELDDSDKLEIAGRDILRAQNVMCLAADLVGVEYTKIGQAVILDNDRNWAVKTFRVAPDGATVTFLLFDAR